ncbi:FkbM family methyltransferase [Cognatishimia sp.]|uniref:FkbM family methyltransferase n=1 Tax=Cognatishimia sp. TaxID=2211648 RepID=UPI0035182C6A
MALFVKKHPESADLFGSRRLNEAKSDFMTLFSSVLHLNHPDAQMRSQFGQDVFALMEHRFKRNGFFVEFGATNGIDISNTYMLERDFGWTGILAEPGRVWHDALHKNRTAKISTDCVWARSGETLEFLESSEPELSTIMEHYNSDGRNRLKRKQDTYQVQTISLNDLLSQNDAPHHIDYLSIDTEGSELEILSELDFEKYSFGVITCEHNYQDARAWIHELLGDHGYHRKLIGASGCDDWYVGKPAL